MSEIELVIKIDEEDYKKVLESNNRNYEWNDMCSCYEAVFKGTPLPKGHGDLKDEIDLDLFAPSLGTDEYVDDLMAKHGIDYVNGDDEDKVRAFAIDLIHGCMNVIETAPAIIEVNKEDNE